MGDGVSPLQRTEAWKRGIFCRRAKVPAPCPTSATPSPATAHVLSRVLRGTTVAALETSLSGTSAISATVSVERHYFSDSLHLLDYMLVTLTKLTIGLTGIRENMKRTCPLLWHVELADYFARAHPQGFDA